MHPLVIVVLVLVALSWASAALHWVLLLAYRKPEVSLVALMLNSTASFKRDNFDGAGWPIRRRMLISMLAFAVTILAVMVVSAVTGR